MKAQLKAGLALGVGHYVVILYSMEYVNNRTK